MGSQKYLLWEAEKGKLKVLGVSSELAWVV